MTGSPKASIWVHPDFRKQLKVKASEENMTILGFTAKIIQDETERERIKKKDFWGRIL